MITYLIVLFSTMFFAYVGYKTNSSFFLKIAFVVVFFYLAFRYNYGIDFKSYEFIFNQVKLNTNLGNIEEGWIFINALSPTFSVLIGVLALFYSYTFYRFIKNYVSPNYWWFAILILLLNFSYMITHASAMRQTVAILIFINSIKYILEQKIFKYFLCCLLAFLFHKSAIILIPAYFMQFFNTKSSRIVWLISLIAYLLLALDQSLVLEIYNFFASDNSGLNLDAYSHYVTGDDIVGFRFNNIIYLLLFIIVAWGDKKQSLEFRKLGRLFLLALYCMALSNSVEMVARISYYFFPLSIVLYPSFLKNAFGYSIVKYTFIAIVISVFLVRFYSMMLNPYWYNSLINYYSIFEL